MANRFWVGGTGNTSDTAHWSATTGGAGGETVPVAGDSVTFDSNSGTAATVTVDVALSAASITINKSDLILIHNAGTTLTGAITLTVGTLNTNGQTCSWGQFSSSNTNTRTFTLGASAITLTSATTAWAITATNLSFSGGSSTLTVSGAAATFNSGGGTLTYGSIVLSGSGLQVLGQTLTCTNLTRTGTAVKTDGLSLSINVTCTGTLTLTGQSVTNRLLVQSNTVGTARTITAAAPSITNVDFMNITGSPTAVAAQTDAFGRADSTTTLGTTDTGQAWSVLSGTWGISSNAAYEPGAVPVTQHAAVIDSGLSDCVVQVTVPVLSGLSGNAGVIFRATDDSNYWRFVIGGATDNNWYFQKKVAGSFSLVGTGAGRATGDVLKVVLGGNTITVFKNGTQMATTTDSFNSTATKHGLANSSSSSGGTVARFDDFSVRAVWDLSLATGGSGNCLGNSGITFTTSSTQTATGTASFTWSTHGWTSRVPLPQDDVVINNAFAASQTVTADMPRLGRSIDFTGVSGSPAVSYTTAISFFGSFTHAAGLGSISTGGNIMKAAGRGSYSLTSAGLNGFNTSGGFYIQAPGGTYTFADSFNTATVATSSALVVANGTLIATADVYVGYFARLGFTGTAAMQLGSGTWNLYKPDLVWSMNGSGLSITPGTAVIDIKDTSATAKTFAGGSLSYGTLRHTATGSAALTITGNNTFAALDLECTTARTITFPASGTQTVTGTLTLLGAAGQLLSLRSSATPTKWYINAATTSAQYFDVKDSTASGPGTPIDDSTGGVDSGNNIGWLFVAGGPAGYSSTLLTLGVG